MVEKVSTLDARTRELVGLAVKARENAYAPYSRYRVGCALLDERGSFHVGCNVETANYACTICAERGALVTMVASGGKRCDLIVIATSSPEPAFPCGECLQMIQELGPGATVVAVDQKGTVYRKATMRQLLPYAFSKEMLTP